MADNSIFLQLPADKLLAITAYGEAAGEGSNGMMAVLNVIANRAQFPDTYADQNILAVTGSVWHAVVLKPYQFSVFNDSDPVRSKMVDMAYSFDSYSGNSTVQQALNLAQMAVAGILEDNTGGSTNYFANSIAAPSWASSMDYITTIGNHIFYSALPVWERIRTVVSGAVETVTENPVSSGAAFIALAMIGYLLYSGNKSKRRT